MKRFFIYNSILILLFLVVGCSLDPEVADNLEAGNQQNVDDLRTLMDGAYFNMEDYRYMGRNYIIAGEIMADNAFANNSSGRFTRFSSMDLLYTDGDVEDMFRRMYATVSSPNIVINSDLSELTGNEEDLNYILGEAYAMRAMVHFDLLRMFGQKYIDGGDNLGVAYIKEFQGEEATSQARGSADENRSDIYADIEEAINYFKEAQSSSYNNDKTRLSLDAVYALETRVGVYFGGSEDYAKVREAAAELYGKYDLTPAEDLVEYWASLSPGPESIFELEYDGNTGMGSNSVSYIYRGNNYGDVQAVDNLIEDAEFDANDVRASEGMIGLEGSRNRNMGKYPHHDGTLRGQDNIKVFRYAEVLLNYAEAMMNEDPGKALDLLNEVAVGRNADPYSSIDMDIVIKERRKELMFEGFRLFDLARTHSPIRDQSGVAQNKHGEIEAGSPRMALPIPRQEMDSNSNMVQNLGY